MGFEDLNRFFNNAGDLNILQDSNFMSITADMNVSRILFIEQSKLLFEIPYLFKWLECTALHLNPYF